MAKLTTIEGIGETYAKALADCGINTTEALLEKGATPAGRQALADESGISRKLILKWVNRADLFRIKGIGEEYADLLEVANVNTVPDLARRNPENLYPALVAANEGRNLVRKLPSEAQVAEWVALAKALPVS